LHTRTSFSGAAARHCDSDAINAVHSGTGCDSMPARARPLAQQSITTAAFWQYTIVMTYPDYDTLYDRACTRKGGESVVEGLLPQVASQRHLKQLGSDRYLAEFTRKVFQSGFVWRVVDKKWQDFEHVFWQFDIERLLMMPDDMLERKAVLSGVSSTKSGRISSTYSGNLISSDC